MLVQETDGTASIFHYYPLVLTESEVAELQAQLMTLTFKSGDCPRKQLWFQEDNRYFGENWHKRYNRWVAEPAYPEFLSQLQSKVQQFVQDMWSELNHKGVQCPIFNSCLINVYEGGGHSIKAHRDNQSSFGPNPTILGVSVGTPRSIKLERNDTGEIHECRLDSGSIYIMAGSLQDKYLHSIPKTDDVGTRYSLTFREYIGEKTSDNR